MIVQQAGKARVQHRPHACSSENDQRPTHYLNLGTTCGLLHNSCFKPLSSILVYILVRELKDGTYRRKHTSNSMRLEINTFSSNYPDDFLRWHRTPITIKERKRERKREREGERERERGGERERGTLNSKYSPTKIHFTQWNGCYLQLSGRGCEMRTKEHCATGVWVKSLKNFPCGGNHGSGLTSSCPLSMHCTHVLGEWKTLEDKHFILLCTGEERDNKTDPSVKISWGMSA